MSFKKIWSIIVQFIAIVLIIYYISFKNEITPKDVVNMVFWCTMFLVEEVRQFKWLYESKDEEIDNKDNN